MIAAAPLVTFTEPVLITVPPVWLIEPEPLAVNEIAGELREFPSDMLLFPVVVANVKLLDAVIVVAVFKATSVETVKFLNEDPVESVKAPAPLLVMFTLPELSLGPVSVRLGVDVSRGPTPLLLPVKVKEVDVVPVKTPVDPEIPPGADSDTVVPLTF